MTKPEKLHSAPIAPKLCKETGFALSYPLSPVRVDGVGDRREQNCPLLSTSVSEGPRRETLVSIDKDGSQHALRRHCPLCTILVQIRRRGFSTRSSGGDWSCFPGGKASRIATVAQARASSRSEIGTFSRAACSAVCGQEIVWLRGLSSPQLYRCGVVRNNSDRKTRSSNHD